VPRIFIHGFFFFGFFFCIFFFGRTQHKSSIKSVQIHIHNQSPLEQPLLLHHFPRVTELSVQSREDDACEVYKLIDTTNLELKDLSSYVLVSGLVLNPYTYRQYALGSFTQYLMFTLSSKEKNNASSRRFNAIVARGLSNSTDEARKHRSKRRHRLESRAISQYGVRSIWLCYVYVSCRLVEEFPRSRLKTGTAKPSR
jgi:hypothetical protein